MCRTRTGRALAAYNETVDLRPLVLLERKYYPKERVKERGTPRTWVIPN